MVGIFPVKVILLVPLTSLSKLALIVTFPVTFFLRDRGLGKSKEIKRKASLFSFAFHVLGSAFFPFWALPI